MDIRLFFALVITVITVVALISETLSVNQPGKKAGEVFSQQTIVVASWSWVALAVMVYFVSALSECSILGGTLNCLSPVCIVLGAFGPRVYRTIANRSEITDLRKVWSAQVAGFIVVAAAVAAVVAQNLGLLC